jgi:hypothetical protein
MNFHAHNNNVPGYSGNLSKRSMYPQAQPVNYPVKPGYFTSDGGVSDSYDNINPNVLHAQPPPGFHPQTQVPLQSQYTRGA